jgi:hypothetical protein
VRVKHRGPVKDGLIYPMSPHPTVMGETKLLQPSHLSQSHTLKQFSLDNSVSFGEMPRVSDISLLPVSHQDGAWACDRERHRLDSMWYFLGCLELLPGLVNIDVQCVPFLGILPVFAEDYGLGSLWCVFLSW